MGMFDSVYADIKCEACGKSGRTEIQFKAHAGKYSPMCETYKIGSTLLGFPRMPVFETDGYPCFDCCETDEMYHSALIRITRGILDEVIFPLPEDHEWATLPRGRLWKRREAANKEDYERRYQEWEKTQKKDIEALGPEGVKVAETIEEAIGSTKGLRRIAFAMAMPLMRSLDYSGFGEAIIREGETENYRRGLDGKWKRRRHRRLF